MNKKVAIVLLKIYSPIRKILEKFMFKKFSQKLEYETKRWENAKLMSIKEFGEYINSFEYLSDKGKGLFDMSFPVDKPEYFFSELKWGRDCDDFARIWGLYLKYNGWEEVKEVIVTNSKKFFSKSHVVLIAKKDNEYWLFNYAQYGPFNTFDEAVKDLHRWPSYEADTLVWTKYREL